MSTDRPAGAEETVSPVRERWNRLFQGPQKMGRSLQLPIAVLPAAGIFNRLGQPDVFGDDGDQGLSRPFGGVGRALRAATERGADVAGITGSLRALHRATTGLHH
ncbi:hypothetical protein GCM10009535_31670 [Streptomyces thermocarboxydovorans]|uniref:Uncharacterized protein n=1 Tax=Streptomyces thermocarboxydovorans TaxID=59298 RepID=A0ABP3SPK6_9ACTN